MASILKSVLDPWQTHCIGAATIRYLPNFGSVRQSADARPGSGFPTHELTDRPSSRAEVVRIERSLDRGARARMSDKHITGQHNLTPLSSLATVEMTDMLATGVQQMAVPGRGNRHPHGSQRISIIAWLVCLSGLSQPNVEGR